jgi:hypothetical protein
MQEIQLYIQGEQVELFKDESVSITQSIQNVKDIAKVFTEFTKSFTVPASKKNNRIFKHYYNYDIVGGFDARQKVASTIELNYLPFKNGFIKLEGVDLKNNSPYAYRLTFFGATVNLKDLLGEDKLDALGWLDNFVIDYSLVDIKAYFQSGADITVDSTTYTDAILVPLISHTKRLYYDSAITTAESGNLHYSSSETTQGVYWKDLKYSIRVHLIVLAIQEAYPEIQFSTDFFNTSNSAYYDLYMWMHRKKGDVQASATGVQTYTQIVDSFPTNSILTDAGGSILNGTTLVIPTYQSGGCWAINSTSYFITTTSTNSYNAIFKRNGAIIGELINVTGNQSFSLPQDSYGKTLNGNYTVTLESSVSITFNYVRINFLINDDCDIPPQTYNTSSTSSSVTINEVFQFYPTQQLPEMKIIDFLTGLFKTFNLTAYEQDGIIKVETLDSYYSSFDTYDISEFVDVNTSAVNVGLPYKEISFVNKGTDSFFASVFNQLNNREYGQLDYKGEENLNWEGSIYKVELPFEHLLYERLYDGDTSTLTSVQWGWMADDNQESYIGAPLIHYVDRQSFTPSPTSTYISFRDTETTRSGLYYYYIPLNSNNTSGTGQSLNFFAEIDSYSLTVNNQTLFANYYVNYIKDVFNIKRRLTKLKAFLPLRILLNFNLSDRFDINGQRYKINSITTNLKTGESDIELLNEV